MRSSTSSASPRQCKYRPILFASKRARASTGLVAARRPALRRCSFSFDHDLCFAVHRFILGFNPAYLVEWSKMDQVTWFCTKLDQVTWICKILDQVTCSAQFEGQVTWFRKIVDQVTWETKYEDQITSTTILQKWTRLPVVDRWASEWHLVFHQLALQLSGPVLLVRRRHAIADAASFAPRSWVRGIHGSDRLPIRHAPPAPNWPRPGNLAHFWPRPGNLVHQPGNLVHFCKIVVEVIWSSHFVSQVTWSTILRNQVT